MIKVNIIKEKQLYRKINVTGHANYLIKDQEYDVVCASVSSIVFGILNMLTLKKFKGRITVEDNLIIISFLKVDNNEIIDLIIETMIVQLSTISESYPNNLKIKELKNV